MRNHKLYRGIRMRLATYNIFEGARDTYALLIEFVRRHDFDILCFQEADDWHTTQEGDRSRLEDFAARTGLGHYVFGNSNTVCKLVTYSRFPITKAKIYTEGFHHCAVQTTVDAPHGPLTVLNVHKTPFSPAQRYHEARRITKIATAEGVDAIVGDINHLSRLDNYLEPFEKGLKANGNKRYGAKKLCYGVTDHYKNQGYIDTAAYLGANENTFPTPIQTDPFHRHVMRLDYIYVPPMLAEAIKDFEVIKNELTDQISDHYPSVITLGMPTAAVHSARSLATEA